MGKKQKVTNEMALYEFMSVGRLMLARIFAMGLSLFFYGIAFILQENSLNLLC
ncbi:hypothetical protein [Veillonella parvula]|uniref:hypothetical protein n=1 Tax=Veillonella parvula TaxID=29466 RepID=UPI0029018BD3|nr:hypothetical protein [Veillonella parvula]MDU3190505.1 hypothetical protein [Veillonella parvula]MDU6072983.1 hypothetical protein [Veillonella parvula]